MLQPRATPVAALEAALRARARLELANALLNAALSEFTALCVCIILLGDGEQLLFMSLKELGVSDLMLVESVVALSKLGSGRPLQGGGALDGTGIAVCAETSLLAVAANVTLGGQGRLSVVRLRRWHVKFRWWKVLCSFGLLFHW